MNKSSQSPELDLPTLVRRSIDGDPQSLEKLAEVLLPAMRSAVCKAMKGKYALDIQDVLQSAWVRVQEALPEWRGTGLFAFVRSVSHNVAIDVVRYELAHPKSQLPIDAGEIEERPTAKTPEEELNKTAQLELLRKAAKGINDERLRQVLDLRLQDMTFEEIGRQMNMSERWAGLAWQRILSYLHRATI